MSYIIIAENMINKQRPKRYEYIVYNTVSQAITKMTISDMQQIGAKDRINWIIQKPSSTRKYYRAIKDRISQVSFVPSTYINGEIDTYAPTIISANCDEHVVDVVLKNGSLRSIGYTDYIKVREQNRVNNELVLVEPDTKEGYIPIQKYIASEEDRDIRLYVTGNKTGMQIEYVMIGKVRRIKSIWNGEKGNITVNQTETKSEQKPAQQPIQKQEQQSIEFIPGDVHLKRIAELENEKKTLIKRIDELSEDLEFQKQLKDIALQKVEDNNNDLNKSLEQKDLTIAELKSNIADLGKKLEDIQSQLSESEGKLKERSDDLYKSQQEVAELALKLSQLKKQLEDLKSIPTERRSLYELYQDMIDNSYPYDRITVSNDILEQFRYKLIEIIDQTSTSRIDRIRINKRNKGGYVHALLHISENSQNSVIQVLGSTDSKEREPDININIIKRNYNAWLRTTKFIRIEGDT